MLLMINLFSVFFFINLFTNHISFSINYSEKNGLIFADADAELDIKFQPFKYKTIENIRVSNRQERIQWLIDANYNLFNLESDQIIIDLLTDSGNGLTFTYILFIKAGQQIWFFLASLVGMYFLRIYNILYNTIKYIPTPPDIFYHHPM